MGWWKPLFPPGPNEGHGLVGQGDCLDISSRRGWLAVLAAEAIPVHSVAQEWLRLSQPKQLPSPPLVQPPQAVDRDRKRIMQTHSWIKLVLRRRCRKGGIHYEHLEGPGASTLAARWPGEGVAAASPRCDTGAALRLSNYISGSARGRHLLCALQRAGIGWNRRE